MLRPSLYNSSKRHSVLRLVPKHVLFKPHSLDASMPRSGIYVNIIAGTNAWSQKQPNFSTKSPGTQHPRTRSLWILTSLIMDEWHLVKNIRCDQGEQPSEEACLVISYEGFEYGYSVKPFQAPNATVRGHNMMTQYEYPTFT